MQNLDVVQILGLGVIGLGFLLALLAYWLLRQEQARENPNPAVLRAIYLFMGFSIVLCLIGIVSQYVDGGRISREEHNGVLKVKEARISEQDQTIHQQAIQLARFNADFHEAECPNTSGPFSPVFGQTG